MNYRLKYSYFFQGATMTFEKTYSDKEEFRNKILDLDLKNISEFYAVGID